jgi:hypothetical protein
VTITPKTVRVSQTGTMTLSIKCPTGESRCRASLKLKLNGRAVAGKATTINGGKTAKVALRLSKAARSPLARKGSLKVTATCVTRDAAGNARTTRTQLTRKPAAEHRTA